MNRMLAWFAENRVAANLLMILILVGGGITAFTLRQEVFPEMSSDMISVSVVYPGAAPEEVEDGVVTRIEDAIQGVQGIEQVTSTAAEGIGLVTAELLIEAEAQQVLADVKNRVDGIASFPEEAEEPIIQEVLLRRQVINVAVSGDIDERALKELGRGVRDDLAAIPGITQVELAVARPYEIAIEVSEADLRRFGLTFDELVAAVRRSSLDLPGGALETAGGEILLRTEGQAYTGAELERLPLVTRPDGSRLLLGDVATVVDGFADTDQAARFDGEPAVLVQVFRVGAQDAIEVADKTKAYVAARQPSLPPGVELTLWADDTEILKGRRDLMLKNGFTGFLLVLVVLALFLRLKLAGWVALGIPISFLGAIWLMPTLDVTINLLTLFAFVLVLGIVVDDAIVVGENIYSRFQTGAEGVAAAQAGVQEVAVPVVFAVLTTVAAFSPLLSVPGNMGKFMRVIPLIVIPVLLFSLVESLLILPAHLSHLEHRKDRSPNRLRRAWQRFQGGFASALERFNRERYGPAVERALEWRYLSLAGAVGLLVVIGALVAGGWVKFTFLPSVEAENVVAILTMPQGTPAERTAEAVARLEASAREVTREIEEETGEDVVRHVLASVGQQPFRLQQSQNLGDQGPTSSGGHLGEVNLQLSKAETRNVGSAEIAERWRRAAGAVPGAEELTFTDSLFNVGEAINVQLAGSDLGSLQAATERVKDELRRFTGVEEIADSFQPGKQEIELELTPEAEALGLTLSDLGRQVRSAFFGAEAQRIQRGREEVKVMVRYPEAERESLGNLEDMRVRAPGGAAGGAVADGGAGGAGSTGGAASSASGAGRMVEIPFSSAARATMGRGYASIKRVDRRRAINVTADVDETEANANEILARLEAEVLPQVLRDYPGVSWSFEGEQKEQRESLAGLGKGLVIALLMIYILLAMPFRSYFQPLIIMSAIPFGLIGAVLGHMVLGMELTILSGFGIVALTGVVVNDSLVMVDFINRAYRGGAPLSEAIREAGMSRFRPILLTSLTTFAGLTPILLEKSLQAQFLIPMAVSLAFGVLFATVITLFLIPVLYGIYQDARGGLARVFGKDVREGEEEAEEAPSEPAPARA